MRLQALSVNSRYISYLRIFSASFRQIKNLPLMNKARHHSTVLVDEIKVRLDS